MVTTMAEAQIALRGPEPFDMVLIGIHFDESRMFDLLRLVKADRQHWKVPVICFRGGDRPETQGRLAMQGIELACGALGANALVDVVSYKSENDGDLALRAEVERLLPGSDSE